MTQFISIRSERYEHDISYQLFDSEQSDLLLSEDSETLVFRQNHTLGFINKIGLAWSGRHVKVGATFTTPMYGPVLRSASIWYTRRMIDPGSSSVVSYTFENKGKYKTPFNARVGIEYSGKSIIVALSADYFHKVNEYARIRTWVYMPKD